MSVETRSPRAGRAAPSPTNAPGRPSRRWRVTPGHPIEDDRTAGGDLATQTEPLVLSLGEPTGGRSLVSALATRGLDASLVRTDGAQRLPDPAQLPFAILAGAAVSHADGTRPWTPDVRDWLRAADAAGTPVLALGTGAEQLAIALGGGVEPASVPHVGFTLVQTTAPRLISPGPWLAFSDQTIVLPPNARPLAHDGYGPKAFRVGRHLALHLHPYASPALVGEWLLAARAGLDLVELGIAANSPWPVPEAAFAQLLDGFLASV